MEINLTSEETFKKIKESLELKEPLLALRYGDGEAILLKNQDDKAVKHIFRRQLGSIFKKEDIEEVKSNLIEAVNNADIIGVPTLKHIKLGLYWKDSIEVLNSFCKVRTLHFSSIDFNYEFLKDWNKSESCYDRLLKDMPELYLISCRDVEIGFTKRFNIKKVHQIKIPPEMMFEEKKYIGKLHYPNRYYEIKKEIQFLGNLKGKLLLYGAGFVGKIYGLLWKLQGGVAVDIGSVFDSFAGKKTRGTRSPTAINLTYKL